MGKGKQKYRDFVISNYLKSQNNYDKAMLTLTGGAFTISLALFNSIINFYLVKNTYFLYLAWLTWTLSIVCLILSLKNSSKAWEETISQIDDGSLEKNPTNVGEPYTSRVEGFNNGGFILFLMGLLCFLIFLIINIEV